jgi:hypothetical protein
LIEFLDKKVLSKLVKDNQSDCGENWLIKREIQLPNFSNSQNWVNPPQILILLMLLGFSEAFSIILEDDGVVV